VRYYELSIYQKGVAKPQFSASTVLSNGKYNSSALQIVFDIPVAAFSTPTGTYSITIYGVPLENLSQAKAYTGGLLTLKAGFQKGLPLANPSQAGTIVVGRVFQCYGDWEGTSTSLTFVVQASPYGFNSPGNIALNCNKGEDLRNCIKSTLSTAFPSPDFTINMKLTNPLIATRNLQAYYHTLEAFAADIVQVSNELSGNQYQVYITIQKGVVNVFQAPLQINSQSVATLSSTPIQLSSLDFIGQPIWIRPNVIQCNLHMRADLLVGGIIRMPKNMESTPGYVRTTNPSLPSSLKYESNFKGRFIIPSLRFTGNSRGTDEKAWVTIAEAAFYGS
jgi:hypothetical protein